MTRKHFITSWLVVTALIGSAPHAHANVDWIPPVGGPVESNITISMVDDWNIATFRQGGLLYKGMEIACQNIMSNIKLDNRFATTPSWFGNQDVADDYAIRATAKAYLKTQTTVVGKRIENFDPKVASLAVFVAVRDLVLFPIIDEHNIKKLLGAIRNKIDKQLATPVGQWLSKGEWRNVDEDPEDVVMIGTDQFYKNLFDLSRKANRAAINQYIANNGQLPLGMNNDEANFMYQRLRTDGWTHADATTRTMRRNKKVAYQIVDELIRLQRQWFVLRFATGYDMGWAEQKRVLGHARVASRNVADEYDRGMGPIVYDLKLANGGPAFASIGPAPDQFNRISMMDKDLELVGIIKEYVNVDGYWAPEVPSLWHRDQRFHSEIALISPRLAVDFNNQCLAPDVNKAVPMKELAGDD